MNFKGLVLIFFGITVSWMIGSITPSSTQAIICTVPVTASGDPITASTSQRCQTNHLVVAAATRESQVYTETEHERLSQRERVSVHTYLIHFDTDRTTPNNFSEIYEVVSVIRQLHDRQNVTIRSIRIEGHADTVASHAYNYDLSRRRAERVASLLQKAWGYRLYDIYDPELDYFGETRLRVPTFDEVDEPENRRVEIVLVLL